MYLKLVINKHWLSFKKIFKQTHIHMIAFEFIKKIEHFLFFIKLIKLNNNCIANGDQNFQNPF